jgi:hypothetical protein
VLVGTRRSEQTNGATTVTNKDLKLNLVQAGQRWKVESAVWQ